MKIIKPPPPAFRFATDYLPLVRHTEISSEYSFNEWLSSMKNCGVIHIAVNRNGKLSEAMLDPIALNDIPNVLDQM